MLAELSTSQFAQPGSLTSFANLKPGSSSSAMSAKATLTEAAQPYYVLEQSLGQGVKLVIEFQGEKPHWLPPVLENIRQLLCLSPNWNSYKARPVNIASVREALRVMLLTMQGDTPIPAIVPTPRGTVQLEWHLRGIDLEVEALPSGLIHLSYEDSRDDDLIEDLTTSNLDKVNQALAKISERK
jgi:hypothetical protein